MLALGAVGGGVSDGVGGVGVGISGRGKETNKGGDGGGDTCTQKTQK